MFCMSEQEKLEQIGALVEELSKLKGHLAHVAEKLQRAALAFVGLLFVAVDLRHYRSNGQGTPPID
jgi:hypothetical protein